MDHNSLYWYVPIIGKGVHIILGVLTVERMMETIRSNLPALGFKCLRVCVVLLDK